MATGSKLTIKDLLASGSNAFVAWHEQHGYSHGAILDALRSRFKDALPQAITAAALRGYDAARAGRAAQNLDPTGKLKASQVPGGPADCCGYRYTTLVSFFDPMTGTTRDRTVQVSSPKSLSHGEVSSMAEKIAREMAGNDPSQKDKYQVGEGHFVVTQTIYAVEREM